MVGVSDKIITHCCCEHGHEYDNMILYFNIIMRYI